MQQDRTIIAPGKALKWGGWLLPIVAIGIISLSPLDLPPLTAPVFLLPAINAVFMTVALLAAIFAGWGYIAGAPYPVLLFGCGMLVFGMASLSGSILLGLGMPDAAVTSHNLAAMLSALLNISGAIEFVVGTPSRSNRGARVALWSVLCCAGIAAIVYAATHQALPPFLVSGKTTPIRTTVVTLTVSLFLSTAGLLVWLEQQARATFLRWYWMGMCLIAMGLTSVGMGEINSPLSWTGRFSQYLGGIYVLICLLSVARSGPKAGDALVGPCERLTRALRESESWKHIAQEGLRSSEERLRLALSSGKMATWDWHFPTNDVVWNEEHYRMMGYCPGEVDASFEAWRNRVHPDDLAHAEAVFRECMRRGGDYRVEFRSAWPDGTIRWIDARGRVKLDHAAGSPVRCYGVMLDTTEQKSSEQALRESEKRLRRSQEIAHVGGWELDLEKNHLTWSDEVYRIFGLQPQEFPATYEAFLETVHPDDRAAVDQAYTSSLQDGRDGYEIEHRLIRKASGELRYVHEKCEHVRDSSGKIIRSMGIVHDITSRKINEQRLARTASRLALLSDISAELMVADQPQIAVGELCRRAMQHLDCQVFLNFLVDSATEKLYLNSCAGVSQEMMQKIKCLDRTIAVCGCIARGGATTGSCSEDPRVKLLRAQGVRAYCCHPLNAQGRVIGTLSFGTLTRDRFDEDDISLMKTISELVAVSIQRLLLLEEARSGQAKAERANSVKDRFIASLSHELRTPLTPVLAVASTLARDQRLPADVREDMATIDRNVGLEVHLINDLLDVTRIASGKLHLSRHPCDAAAVVRDAARIVSFELDSKALHLEISAPDGPYPLAADAARLQQVFWNLLHNAVKFTPHGGRIVVSCRRERHASGPRALISVRDSGIGIDPAVLPRIFDAFEQGHQEDGFGGLGLGLAICRGIVEAHAGHISARSPGRGKGAEFTVELPLCPDQILIPPAVGTPAIAVQEHVRKFNILLVEDHVDTARLISRLLRAEGHEVEHVGSVQEAMAAMGCRSFDALISDLGLPDGSGHELMRALGGSGRRIPAIAVSGYGTATDVQESLDAGFLEHLIKPITRQSLLDSIVRLSMHMETSRS